MGKHELRFFRCNPYEITLDSGEVCRVDGEIVGGGSSARRLVLWGGVLGRDVRGRSGLRPGRRKGAARQGAVLDGGGRMKRRNAYEKWRDKKYPKETQRLIDGFAGADGTADETERAFRAGWKAYALLSPTFEGSPCGKEC